MTLAALIAKLAAATGGSHELDRDIWRAIGNRIVAVKETGGHVHSRWIDAKGVRWAGDLTDFSTSLDAALRLMPEGWSIHQLNWHADGSATAFPHRPKIGVQSLIPDCGGQTAPLALCIAALKARTA